MSTELVPISVEHDGAMWPLWQSAGSKEPLAKDLDVAAWLGYEHPRRIRSLIKGHAIDLGEVRTAAVQTTEKGGRPSAAYLLTEEQALFIAAKSETPKATQVLKAMIAVFLRARDMMRGAAPAFSAADVDRIIDATAHETVRQLTQDAGTLTAIAQKVRALLGPLTVADKRRAAREALEAWPHLSDRTLAQRAGVGRTLLAEVRAEMGAATAARLGEDGKTRRLPGVQGPAAPVGTIDGPDDVLARFGLVITQGLTTPKREGKKPREVWHVTGTRKEWAPIMKAAKGFWFRPEQHWTFYKDPREQLAAAFADVTPPSEQS